MKKTIQIIKQGENYNWTNPKLKYLVLLSVDDMSSTAYYFKTKKEAEKKVKELEKELEYEKGK